MPVLIPTDFRTGNYFFSESHKEVTEEVVSKAIRSVLNFRMRSIMFIAWSFFTQSLNH